MRTGMIILLVFFIFGLQGQNIQDSSKKLTAYVSKKKTYQVDFDKEQWQILDKTTDWDVEFRDTHDLISVYFKELGYFIAPDKLKQTIKAQFEDIGKVRNLKIYKRKLRYLTVDYFECELKYKGYNYKYQGFVYDNGRSGSVELQFGGEEENVRRLLGLIDEFCNNFREVK